MKTVEATCKGFGCTNSAPLLVGAAAGAILLAGGIWGDAQAADGSRLFCSDGINDWLF